MCSWVMLSALLDEALASDEQQAALSHVETCASCQLRLEHLRWLRNAIARLPHPLLPFDFTASVMARLPYMMGEHPSTFDLNAYVDHELTDEESLAIASHLSDCEPCRDLLAPISVIATAEFQNDAPSMPDDFLSRLFDRIDTEVHLSGEALGMHLDGEAAQPSPHLDQCDPCQTHLEDWAVLGAGMRKLSAPAMPAHFVSSLMENLPIHPLRSDLSEYADGRRPELAEHIEACDVCQAYVHRCGQLSGAIAQLSSSAMSSDFASRVVAQLPSNLIQLNDRRKKAAAVWWQSAAVAGVMMVSVALFQTLQTVPAAEPVHVLAEDYLLLSDPSMNSDEVLRDPNAMPLMELPG